MPVAAAALGADGMAEFDQSARPPAADGAFLRIRHSADRLVEALAVVLMLAMLGVVILGVASRAVNSPLVWTDELAQYLLVWLGFLGWIIATRRGNHIRVTIGLELLPASVRWLGEVAVQLAIIVFAAVLMWQSGPLIRRNLDVETVTLPFPSAMLYVMLPVLAIALLAQAVADIALLLRGARNASQLPKEPKI